MAAANHLKADVQRWAIGNLGRFTADFRFCIRGPIGQATLGGNTAKEPMSMVEVIPNLPSAG